MGRGSSTTAVCLWACFLLHCVGLGSAALQTIVGGLNSVAQEFPFFTRSTGDALCGGALVAPDVVLTAAHCAAAFHSKVLVGSYNYFLDQNSSTTFKRTVLSGTRTLHPDYDHFALRNDLMLFKIDPVPIKPAVLNLDPAAPAPGQAFTVIGFGELTPNASVTDPPEYPATLQKVRQFVVDGATCQQRWGIDADFIDNGTMICAEANSSTPSGVCGGDSGGPLLDSQRRVVGIVSFGPQVCGIPGGSPAVYTRLSAYKSWLQETICRLSDEAPLPFCNISALRCPVDTTIVGWPARLPDRTFRLLDWNDTPVISQVPPPGTTVAQGATLTVNLTQKVRLMSSSCTWKVTNPATEEMAVARFVVAPGTTSSTHPVSFYYSVPIFGREPCHVGTSYWVQRMYAQVVEPYANPVLRGRTPTSNVTVTLLTPFGERTRVPVAILHGQARSRAHVFPTPGVACLSEQGLKVAVNGWGITSSVVVEVYLYGQKMFL